MTIDYSKKFLKQYSRLSPKLQSQADNRMRLWEIDPTNPQLRNHALSGKYQGYRSISITGDIRALYTKKGEKTVIFGFIGSHSQLYN